MVIHNAAVADTFNRLADLLEIQNANPFRVRSYRTAAQTVSGLPRSVTEMVEEEEDLSDLPGIGDDLAGKIEEIVKTGALSLLEEMEKEVPSSLSELMTLSQLGAKRVKKLHEELGVDTLDDLAKAAKQGKVRDLPGFGSKTEQKILDEIQRQRGRQGRMSLADAEQVVVPLMEYIKAIDGVKQAVVAGSFRRRKETVGDIDVLATCKRATDVIEQFVKYDDVEEVLSQGSTRATVRLRSGLQVDLRVVPETSSTRGVGPSWENCFDASESVMPEKLDFKKNPTTKFKDVDKISEKEAKREIEALREGIEHHDYLYYVKNKPEISDAVYDKLFRRLQELEAAFPKLQSEDSPTRRVGAEPVSALKKVEHAAPMLSLNAVLEDKEVEDFDRFVRRQAGQRKLAYVLEPKFDGVSVEVVYEKGRFQYGATRGDGQTGEEISANLRTIGALRLRLRGSHSPEFLAVRGEVFLPREGFQRMNRQRVDRGEEPLANPRNAAAGILKRLDSREVAKWPLDIVFYDILKVEGAEFETHQRQLKQFEKWGLKINERLEAASSLSQIHKYWKNLADERDELPYEIDGIVIKVDDLALRQELGQRHRSPRWALAWKFEPRQEVTVLEDIVVQVGRTGKLTPVALLQPVDVGGVTVSRATLHNEDEVRRHDVRIGDKVRIARAGDVIPEVVGRIEEPGKKRSREFSMPNKCPACGAQVVRQGAYHLCPAGLSCPAQLVGRLIHYGSREAMDIEGLGKETATQLVERGMVKELADLYKLSVRDLKGLEGFAEKLAKSLHDAIEDAKRPRLDRFLYGLGIPQVGKRTARVLAERFRSAGALSRASEAQLREVEEIGPEVAKSVHAFFSEKENRQALRRLAQAGVKAQDMPAKTKKRRALQGKTFVFTGGLARHTRDEAKEKVESLGARAASSVSGRADYVVVGEDPGSKLDDARRENVEILDEEQFEELLEKAGT